MRTGGVGRDAAVYPRLAGRLVHLHVKNTEGRDLEARLWKQDWALALAVGLWLLGFGGALVVESAESVEVVDGQWQVPRRDSPSGHLPLVSLRLFAAVETSIEGSQTRGAA